MPIVLVHAVTPAHVFTCCFARHKNVKTRGIRLEIRKQVVSRVSSGRE